MNGNNGSKTSNNHTKKQVIIDKDKILNTNTRRKVPLDKLLEIIATNETLTYEEIGKIFGVSRQAIHQNIQLLEIDQKEIPKFQHFRENKGIHIEKQQFRIINHLDEDRPKGRDLRDATIAFATFLDKQQLLEGKPTSIDFGLIAHVKANDDRNLKDVTPKEPDES